ncbi:MAG: ABC transporter ATP-binding protein [Lachnospiraceae bacterium]|nr:ABC transporter ATP-binding protein [Lachnospiraceae bacterium]
MSNIMVQADNLMKIYKTKDIEVVALQGLDLTVEEGELMAIIGNSGSGKSTFLNMLGGLDKPSAGKLYVDGQNLFSMTEKQLVDYKRKTVGFVWQNNARNLFPFLTAMENVMVPMQISSGRKCKERALELLDMVGLADKRKNKLSQLSGGEQQRVAIAIAVANSPKLLLADEPTGSVDSKTSDYILDLFRRLNREWGQTIILVTHDVMLSKKVQRVAAIRDGKISSERILKDSHAELLTGGVTSWEEETQDEFAIIDRAGRVQIPREILDTMDLDGNKIRLSVKDGKITLEK